MAEQLAKKPDAMLRALAAEEFGITGDTWRPRAGRPRRWSVDRAGRNRPGDPVRLHHGNRGDRISAGVSLIAHFLVGAAKSLVTLRSWWSAGFEMTLAGVIVGGATYLVGLALPT